MNDATLVTVAGRDPERQHGVVNPPVYHASTILFPTVAAMEAARPRQGTTYGRYGTPTTFGARGGGGAARGRRPVDRGGLRQDRHHLDAAGAAAHAATMCWSRTRSTRRPAISAPARSPASASRPPTTTRCSAPASPTLIRPETRLVFTESPGSLTFEMQDIPAIAEAAHAQGCLVVMDNTWASPLFCKPFRLGVDISVQAATKYIGGHSDLMMGVVTCTEAVYERLWRGMLEVATAAGTRRLLPGPARPAHAGGPAGAPPAQRAGRGRMADGRPEVRRVLYPALPERSRPRALEA